jgi:hypothetical protein
MVFTFIKIFLKVPFRFVEFLFSFLIWFFFSLSFLGLGNELEGLEGWLLSFDLFF